jgi:hypothetical protein
MKSRRFHVVSSVHIPVIILHVTWNWVDKITVPLEARQDVEDLAVVCLKALTGKSFPARVYRCSAGGLYLRERTTSVKCV